MIGQERLEQHFNTFTLNTLPHSIMFVGPNGSGRHTLCNLISKRLMLNLIEVNDKVDIDFINAINTLKEPTLCVIDGDYITYNEEPILLKFIEEPETNIFIIVLSSNINQMLPTIKNRCSVYIFDNYSKSTLEQFCLDAPEDQKQVLLEVANTPGKIITWKSLPLTDMQKLATQIFEILPKASIANILNIINKVDFDDKIKFPYTPFINTLSMVAKTRVIANAKNATLQYRLTNELVNNSTIPNINKQKLLENFLYKLKEMCYERI